MKKVTLKKEKRKILSNIFSAKVVDFDLFLVFKFQESWLNQIKEMQLHCDQGLQFNHWTPGYGVQHLGISEQGFR